MKELIKEILNSVSERELRSLLCGDCGDDLHELFHSNGIDYNEVRSHGGEDMGSEYWRIYSLISSTGETANIKLYGYYSSYDGVEYRGYFFVKPVQVLTTQWQQEH